MVRYAFNTLSACSRSLKLHDDQFFSTTLVPGSRARVGQILAQAQPAGPTNYKTVKKKDQIDNAFRRNQLIWLVKHSLGKEAGIAKVTPHDMEWSDGPAVKKGCGAQRQGHRLDVTVWPHLWSVAGTTRW